MDSVGRHGRPFSQSGFRADFGTPQNGTTHAFARAVASRRDCCLIEQTTRDFSIRMMPTWSGDRAFAASRANLLFRNIANKLGSSAQDQSRPLPGGRRIVPVHRVVRRITGESAGQVLPPAGAPARDGPRTASARSGLPARRHLRTARQPGRRSSPDPCTSSMARWRPWSLTVLRKSGWSRRKRSIGPSNARSGLRRIRRSTLIMRRLDDAR